MNFPFYIARRYLFSKKSHNAINIISMVSVCGIVVATVALVCALSVYNGFSDLVSSLFSNFDPELKITPRSGKVFDPKASVFDEVRTMDEIECYSEVLQDNAASIDSILIDGAFRLNDEVANYANMGIGLAYALGINAGFVSPMEIYVPKRDAKVNMSNPVSSFNVDYAFISSVFRTDQQAYDETYMIVPLDLARSLFQYETEVSAIELKVRDGADVGQVKSKLRGLLGDEYEVKDRFEQQETSFKMMRIEKWMTFLILSFILAIALFNVVGSLSMLMIEKKADAVTLRNMGADDGLIRRIFLFEGWLICGIGAVIGIVIGVLLCLLQEHFGLIQLGESSGAFVIDAYPVRVAFVDVLLVFLTVLGIGFMAAWYPVRYLAKGLLAR